MSETIVLVEDEADLAAATGDYLGAFGMEVIHCPDAASALAQVPAARPGVILLDLNLPDGSGFDLCRRLREMTPAPLLIVSARTCDVDQVRALGLGADDYITKPFSLAVLLAKVRRAMERTASPRTGGATDFDDGHLRVSLSSGRTYLDDQEVHLTAIEDALLRHLVTMRGSVCTKAELLRAVWGDELTSEGTLSVHVRRLRTRIERVPDEPTYIRTVWGRGYLFEGS